MFKFCSPKAYIRSQLSHNSQDQVDTNIIQVKFDTLREKVLKVVNSYPISCAHCEIILNKHSVIIKDANKPQNYTWKCEFCNFVNLLQLQDGDIPTSADVVFLKQQVMNQEKQWNEAGDGQKIIFCIDNSGSMAMTSEVSNNGQIRNALSQEELDMLSQFIEPGHEQQFLPSWKSNVTYISRKQQVFAAIESQIKEFKNTKPNKIVGIVTFNSEVLIIGDGTQQPCQLSDYELYIEDCIREKVKSIASTILTVPIKQSAEALIKSFSQLQEFGQTALGPALLASLELAKLGSAGSMVIICTDGMANLGLGSLRESNAEAIHFYSQLADFACENGIIISIVTIKGEGCKMEVLSQLAEKTSGSVTRVNPDQLGKDFAMILKNEIVATNVELTIKLHNSLKFREEDLKKSLSSLIIPLGNVTLSSVVTFEYEIKTQIEQQQEGINIQNVKQVPFQIIVSYKSLNGNRYQRVITQVIDTTQNLLEAEQNVELEIIHRRITQKTAELAKQKRFQEAEHYNRKWDHYVQTRNKSNLSEDNVIQIKKYSERNSKLAQVVKHQSDRSIDHNNIPNKIHKKIPEDKYVTPTAGNNSIKEIQRNQPNKNIEEEDEDQEVADLVNFHQDKY